MKGHILLIADGRSPTARSWITNIQAIGYEVSLISSFPCAPPHGLVHYHHLTLAFSRFSAGSGHTQKALPQSGLKQFIKRFSPIFQFLRYWLGPLTLQKSAKDYQNLVSQIQPDLIHALRIPFEGMLGSYTPEGYPLIVGTWGNDLTLHAKGSPLMRSYTHRCLQRTNGLASDTFRDVRLAHQWGLNENSPALVVPGSGGIDIDVIKKAPRFSASDYSIPEDQPIVINPRGIRPGSVHQHEFFAAIPKILEKHPKCSVVCPGLAHTRQAHEWLAQFGIKENTFLLPNLPQTELWSLLKASAVFVSPSSHDGTPNSLLEAMVCGCYPIVGDIESLREWIDEGKNGTLINPKDPNAIAKAVIEALENKGRREYAAELNLSIIQKRASQGATRPMIDQFYSQFIE
jgi:glycosyltransferase involved in cell wall biosynthesis